MQKLFDISFIYWFVHSANIYWASYMGQVLFTNKQTNKYLYPFIANILVGRNR